MKFDELVNAVLLNELFTSTYPCSYPYVITRDNKSKQFPNFDELVKYSASHVDEIIKVATDFKNTSGNVIQFSIQRENESLFSLLDSKPIDMLFNDINSAGHFKMTNSGIRFKLYPPYSML